jgi:hypothetical protein
MARDFPRNNMPKGYAWNFVDWLPRIGGASVRERGGWTSASNDIARESDRVVCRRRHLPADVGVQRRDRRGRRGLQGRRERHRHRRCGRGGGEAEPDHPPRQGDRVRVGRLDGPEEDHERAGTLTVANLGRVAAGAQYGVVFNDYTAAAGVTATPNRLFFSDPGDPEGWDTTNSFWDMSQPVNGLVALRTALITFHDGYIGRIRGTTPPPGSDFIADDPLFAVGTSDVRSIAVKGDRIVFANGEGIFMTDGSGKPANLTRLAACPPTTSRSCPATTPRRGRSRRVRAGRLHADDHERLHVRRLLLGVPDPLSFWRHSNIDARTMWGAGHRRQALLRPAWRRPRRRAVVHLHAVRHGDATTATAPRSHPRSSRRSTRATKAENVQAAVRRLRTDRLRHRRPGRHHRLHHHPRSTTYTTISDSLAESSTKTTYGRSR